jgi:hypothetical protein
MDVRKAGEELRAELSHDARLVDARRQIGRGSAMYRTHSIARRRVAVVASGCDVANTAVRTAEGAASTTALPLAPGRTARTLQRCREDHEEATDRDSLNAHRSAKGIDDVKDRTPHGLADGSVRRWSTVRQSSSVRILTAQDRTGELVPISTRSHPSSPPDEFGGRALIEPPSCRADRRLAAPAMDRRSAGDALRAIASSRTCWPPAP